MHAVYIFKERQGTITGEVGSPQACSVAGTSGRPQAPMNEDCYSGPTPDGPTAI